MLPFADAPSPQCQENLAPRRHPPARACASRRDCRCGHDCQSHTPRARRVPSSLIAGLQAHAVKHCALQPRRRRRHRNRATGVQRRRREPQTGGDQQARVVGGGWGRVPGRGAGLLVAPGVSTRRRRRASGGRGGETNVHPMVCICDATRVRSARWELGVLRLTSPGRSPTASATQ